MKTFFGFLGCGIWMCLVWISGWATNEPASWPVLMLAGAVGGYIAERNYERLMA